MDKEDAGELSLLDILSTIKKRLGLVVSLTLICSATSFIMSYFILIPVFAATTSIVIQPESSAKEIQYNDIMANQKIVKTYADIITSRSIAEKVIQNLGLNITPEKLQQSITVKGTTDSLVTTITVEDKNPNNAATIANGVAKSFIDSVGTTLKVNNIAILDPAKPNPTPVRPKPLLYTSLAGILGLFLGIGVAIILDIVDKTIKSEKEIMELVGLPVMGVISYFEFEEHNDKKARRKGD